MLHVILSTYNFLKLNNNFFLCPFIKRSLLVSRLLMKKIPYKRGEEYYVYIYKF